MMAEAKVCVFLHMFALLYSGMFVPVASDDKNCASIQKSPLWMHQVSFTECPAAIVERSNLSLLSAVDVGVPVTEDVLANVKRDKVCIHLHLSRWVDNFTGL